jgi:hypothetical protein
MQLHNNNHTPTHPKQQLLCLLEPQDVVVRQTGNQVVVDVSQLVVSVEVESY